MINASENILNKNSNLKAEPKKFEISDEELNSLTKAIKIRYGIDFTNYEKASLKRGFVRLIQKHDLGNIIGLWSRIMKNKDFLITSIDELTVNLTELFRNPEIWIKLRKEILPIYNQASKINFWHAGCSSGEEVYTMAMVLHESNLLLKAETLATDLSTSILEQAKKAKYSNVLVNRYLKASKLYSTNSKMEDWFNVNTYDSEIKEKFKRHISFERHNLVQEPMNKKFDIIFCRNVMIYFDDILKIRVLNLFHSCLNEGGFLVIGYYDMLPFEYKALFEVYDSTTRIYRKK